MFSFRKYLKTQKVAKLITIFLFLAVLFAVGFGIYSFFRWEFSLIAHDAYLRIALPLFFYEGLFLVVFMLVLVSSFITGMFALFRGRSDTLVMASPRYAMIFWRGYWRTFFSSAWPVVLIAFPAFLGSSSVFPVSFLGGSFFLLCLVFLAGIAVALGIALFVVSSCIVYILDRFFWKYFGATGLFSFGMSALFGVIVLAVGLALAWRQAWTGDVVSLFAPFSSAWATSRIDIVMARFSVFPSHLATLELFNAQMGGFGSAALLTVGLAVMFGICLLILRILQWGFLPLWQVFQEGRFEAKPKAPRMRASQGPITFPRFFKSPLGALFEKEGIILFREMRSALWFFFLLVLWGIQVVMEFFIRANLIKYQVDLSTIVARIETLELATAIYFISAFIVRFVFPAFSSERRTAWILGTAPLNLKSVFWAKFLFYAAVFLTLGLVFTVINFSIIEAVVANVVAFVCFAFLMIVFLVAFGLGLGAIFPNFESDDPEVLSTTLPGLGFIFGALIYGGIGSYLFYLFLAGGPAAPLVGFDILTALLTVLMVALALRSLGKIEFIKEYA